MMIFVAVAIVVILLTLAAPGWIGEFRRSRRRWSARPAVLPQQEADWWPEFERQFRAYAREHEREAH